MSEISLAAGKRTIRKALHRLGLDIHRVVWVNSVEERRRQALTENGIDLLLDVGANVGRYAQEARAAGFEGHIVSFEPNPDAFRTLREASASDPLWEGRPVAVGDHDGHAQLNLSADLDSSSTLPITDRALKAAPSAKYIGVKKVDLVKLDSIRDELIGEPSRILLKIDVQGAELEVIRGAAAVLRNVMAIEAEVSLQPVYEGQALITDIVMKLDELGFDIVALEPIFRDPRSGKLLQLDAFFLRRGRGR